MNSRTLRVLSYNIHKGYSTTRRRNVLEGIKKSLRNEPADLIFLQEVFGRHASGKGAGSKGAEAQTAAALAGQAWPHFAYGKNASYPAGHHGNAILSRFPILSTENLDISNSRIERRGLLHARIRFPGLKAPLHAICLHLDLRESGRRVQVERLCARIGDAVPPGEPLIVAGDFNDWRGRISRMLEKRIGLQEVFMDRYGRHARTFPSWCPILRLDRIYVRGLSVRSAHTLFKGPRNRLSDHAAVFSELVFV